MSKKSSTLAAPVATLDIVLIEENVVEGEILTVDGVLTVEAAESLTVEIRDAGVSMVKGRKALTSAIKRAKSGDAHTVLGFASWTAYVADVFAAENLPRMAAADREFLAGFMAGEGMSSRAVATVLGISQSTANRMIKALDVRPDVVIGLDGSEQASAHASDESGEEAPVKAPASDIDKAMNALRKAAATLAESDTTALTFDETSEILAALADISNDVKRFAKSVTMTQRIAPVEGE